MKQSKLIIFLLIMNIFLQCNVVSYNQKISHYAQMWTNKPSIYDSTQILETTTQKKNRQNLHTNGLLDVTIRRTRILGNVRIFIDPGHGGSDPGAVNNGLELYEKDINLQIALKVGQLLSEYGADVLYSRTEDVDVSLDQRVLWANNNDSDIFISIHCNSASDPTVRGFEVYYHGPETVTNNNYSGYVLAHYVHDGVIRETSWSGFSIVDRGVKADTQIYSSGFYVLRNTNMSAILIETLFLSNNDDAQLLINEDFQWSVARGILRGLYRYFAVGKKLYSNNVGAHSNYPSAWLLNNGTIIYAWHTNTSGVYNICIQLTDIYGNVLSSEPLTSSASYHPAVVEAPNGNIFVFYNRPAGTYHNIYYRIYTPGSGWSTEYLLSNSTTGHTSFPHTIRVDARIIVFFHSNRDGDWDLYMKYSDDNGTTWSEDLKIFDTPSDERSPRAFYDGKRIWLVYKALDGTNYYQLCYMYSDDGGITWSPKVQLTFSSVDHHEPCVVGVYRGDKLRIIIFYVYDYEYSTDIFAFYSDDYGATWRWAPITQSPSLEFAPFTLRLTNNSFRLIYSQMILRDKHPDPARYRPADIYYLDFVYEKPKNGRVLIEWHYQSSNSIILNNMDIIDYSMPVTYNIHYYSANNDAELSGWYNRSFAEELNGSTLYVPLIQDLSSSNVEAYLDTSSGREVVARAIQRFIVAEGAPGAGINIEAILSSSYETNMTELFRKIYDYLSIFGVLVFAIVPPKESDSFGWFAYNYTKIGQYCDYFVVMAYEYHGSWSDPGPISPTGRVEKIINYAISKGVDINKIVMAYPLYGYDWYYDNNTSSWVYYRAIFFDDLQSILSSYEHNLSWIYNFSEGTTVYEANELLLEYWGQYYHQVYFPNTESILYKMGLAKYYSIEKFSFWRFGADMDPKLLNFLRKWKNEGIGSSIVVYGVQNGYVELFNGTETIIEVEFVLSFPMYVNISSDTLTIIANMTRNATIYSIDTRILQDDINNLSIIAGNRFETIETNITVYKLNFDLQEVPENITRAANLTLISTKGFIIFSAYISTDGQNWSLLGNVSEIFELNVSHYTNTTIYIKIVGTSINGNKYEKIYGPINIVNYFEASIITNQTTNMGYIELFEKDTVITIHANSTFCVNVSLIINDIQTYSGILLGTWTRVLNTSVYDYGIINITFIATADNYTYKSSLTVYKITFNVRNVPQEVLNISDIVLNLSASEGFTLFNLFYSYDNDSWMFLRNTSIGIITISASIFSGEQIFLMLEGITVNNNSYIKVYGPIRIIEPLIYVIQVEGTPLEKNYLELFENDTTIFIFLNINVRGSLEISINSTSIINATIAEKQKITISIDTQILEYGIYDIKILFASQEYKYNFEKNLKLYKLFMNLITSTERELSSTIECYILHSPGFQYFLVYACNSSGAYFVANTSTGKFIWNTTNFQDGEYHIKIIAISTTNNTYTKVFGPYKIANIKKTPETISKTSEPINIPLLALIIASTILAFLAYKSKKKRTKQQDT